LSSLILASASPRRRELLERVGFAFAVAPADVDEREQPGEPPAEYVRRIAGAKAAAVNAPNAWVLAADTTVTIDGQILGKAATPDEAADMLRRLSGRTHQVLTAFVVRGPTVVERLVATDVTMIELPDATIAEYVASNEWRGKAGAYAIQGIAAALVREIRGSVTNVIGLPLAEVVAALAEAGGPRPQLASGIPA
jgi:septum formation protein